MEELLQCISDKVSDLLSLASDFSFSEVLEKLKSGFSFFFSYLYNFIFVDSKQFILSIGSNVFGAVYNSITLGNFLAYFLGLIVVMCFFKVVVHIVRG